MIDSAAKKSSKAVEIKAIRAEITALRSKLAVLQGREALPRDEFDAYMTPDDVAERLARLAVRFLPAGLERVQVLEPSAGDGALVRAVMLSVGVKYDVNYTAVEIQPKFEAELRATGADRVYIGSLESFCAIPQQNLFDLIPTNPPYKHLQEHMTLMLGLLAPKGICVALLCNNATHGQDRSRDFWRRCIRSKDAPVPADALPALRAYAPLAARPKFRGARGGMRDYAFYVFDAAWNEPAEMLSHFDF